jgi:beta-aspartyl-dipeptidase (metallo-type)
LVRRLLDETELPPRVFHPTHVNRGKELFEEACALSLENVVVDVTAFPVAEGENAWSAADAWSRFHEQACPAENLTISSDGGGCLPVFDQNGRMVKMDFASSASLPETLRELVGRGYSLDQVLPSMTINVARLLRLENKGRIEAGADADFVCLGDALDVRHVMAGGQWMVQDQVPLVHGLFEE